MSEKCFLCGRSAPSHSSAHLTTSSNGIICSRCDLRAQLAESQAFRQRVVEVLAELHWGYEDPVTESEYMISYGLRKAAQLIGVWPEVEARLAGLREERRVRIGSNQTDSSEQP